VERQLLASVVLVLANMNDKQFFLTHYVHVLMKWDSSVSKEIGYSLNCRDSVHVWQISLFATVSKVNVGLPNFLCSGY
jgi:hypothetical protein